MGISVVAQPANIPPRFGVTITTADGSNMVAVSLTRTARGVTVPVRVQPASGFASRYVAEYEGEWGTQVVFTATVTTASGVATYADSAQLNPTGAWMIHPTVPLKSVCFDSGNVRAMGLRSIGQVARPSTSNRLRPIGAALPVQIRFGSRQAPQSQLVLTTLTSAEETTLTALLDDQTPLLIRVPPQWGWGFEDGYYDVDGPTTERMLQYGPDQQRDWTLPIFKVAAPAGGQQSTWSYGDLLAAFPDYPSVAAAYADYPSLLSNTRR